MALYAEISRLRGLRKGVAVATANKAEKATADFILAELEVLQWKSFDLLVQKDIGQWKTREVLC